MSDPRAGYRYTPYFCEENIWWLAREISDADGMEDGAWVCLFSNPSASIAVGNQRAVVPGALMAWDYHVVLGMRRKGAWQVFDFDSRLPFPVPWPTYFRATFPEQRLLPERWRSRMRQIPARSYCERFCSDRSHMVGRVAAAEFPPYAPICPEDAAAAITLGAYRDMSRALDDGSILVDVAGVADGPCLEP
jgi:hypothetical protein